MRVTASDTQREEPPHAGVEQQRLVGVDQELVEGEPGGGGDLGHEGREAVDPVGDLVDVGLHGDTIALDDRPCRGSQNWAGTTGRSCSCCERCRYTSGQGRLGRLSRPLRSPRAQARRHDASWGPASAGVASEWARRRAAYQSPTASSASAEMAASTRRRTPGRPRPHHSATGHRR